MDPHLREEVDVHTDQMEGPFLLQDLRRFLRLDPVRDVADIGEGGEEGRMKARPVHSDDLRQFITGQGSGNLGGQEGGRGGLGRRKDDETLRPRGPWLCIHYNPLFLLNFSLPPLPLELYLRYCVHPPGEAPTSKAFLSFFHISSSIPPSIPSSNRSSHISRILKYARETGGREEEEGGFSKEGGRKERKDGGGAEVGPVREWLCVRP